MINMKEKWIEVRTKDKGCKLCFATKFHNLYFTNPNIKNWHFFFEPFGFILRFEVKDLEKGIKTIKNICKELKLTKFKILTSYSEEKTYKEAWQHVKRYFTIISNISVALHNKDKFKVGKDFNLNKLIHCFLNQNLENYENEMNFHLNSWFRFMMASHLKGTQDLLKRLKKSGIK
nr:hypothetical protein [Nanoarchaeum sp.]